MASLHRRAFLVSAAALAACSRPPPMTASHTPKLNMDVLNEGVGRIARRLAPGALGVALMNLDSGENFTFNGDRRFPLDGLAVAPLAAAALAEVEAGRLPLAEEIPLKLMDLSPPPSPVAYGFPARASYTAGELLQAAVAGDATAADRLMARIGGPGAVSAWLSGKRVEEMRVDRYQREVVVERAGLASFRPAWSRPDAFQAALQTVAPVQRRQALDAYLADPRDTATPRSALQFLHLLTEGALVAPRTRDRLLAMMGDVPPAGRLVQGLPRGSTFAHATAQAPPVDGLLPVMGDMGVATLPGGARYLMAAFLSGAPASPPNTDAAFAEIGRALVRGLA